MPHIQSVIDSRTFAEYMAYYRLEPFGQEPEDQQLAMLISLQANQNRRKGKRVYRLEDFRLWKPTRSIQEPGDIIARFIDWARSRNGKHH